MQKMNGSEMENVQTIVWAIEIVTFTVVVLIAWWVWKISKRAIRKNRSKQVK